MEVLYTQNMKILLHNQVYSTEIFIFPAGGEWNALVGCVKCTGTVTPNVNRFPAGTIRFKETELNLVYIFSKVLGAGNLANRTCSWAKFAHVVGCTSTRVPLVDLLNLVLI
jgi:hypothetical protein